MMCARSMTLGAASTVRQRIGLVLGTAAALAAALAVSTAIPGCASAPEASPNSSVAPKGMYSFWPQFPAEPRIQFVRAISGSEDLSPSAASGLEKLVFGSENLNDTRAIYKPYGVASRRGMIYVCDMRNSCLTVLDIAKKQTRLVGVSGINRLTHPVDVAVADDGTIYVADNERGAVLVFDTAEKYARAIGHEKMKPVSVAVHGEQLYVCDMTSQVVEVYDRKSGNRTGTIGSVGDGDGQFRLPLSVDTDKAGNIFVVDMMRCKVQKFTPDGNFASGLGEMGDFAGAFIRPKHIAVDSDGIVYVVDAAFQNVQMFDDKARLLMAFGAAGPFPGAMDLPAGICVTDEGLELFKDQVHPGFEPKRLVIVTNQFGPGKVSIYVMGQRSPSFALADMAAAATAVSSGVDETKGPRDLQISGDDSSTLGPEPGAEEPAPGEDQTPDEGQKPEEKPAAPK